LGSGKTTFYKAYLKDAFPALVPAVRDQQQRFLDDRRSLAVEEIRPDPNCSTPQERQATRPRSCLFPLKMRN
jgi:hypothetical protein